MNLEGCIGRAVAIHYLSPMNATNIRETTRSLLISRSYYPPQVGGISTMMAEVCSYLGARRVAVLTGVAGPVDDIRLADVRVHRIAGTQRQQSWAATGQLAASLGLALARERPAVLQYATLDDALMAHWTHRALGYKHILYAHGNEILSAGKSTWDIPKSALMASSYVVANSCYTASLLRDLGVPAERIRIVHPGCDLEQFQRRAVAQADRARWTGGRPQARLVLSVGNLVERKGHDIVIRALASLPQALHDVLYLIAGDGPHRAILEALALSVGVADRVVFLGRVPTAELPLLYSAASVFIMASRERADHCDVEGFGIVFIEAAACGAPTIGGRSGGIEDAVLDQVTGLLVDPNDPQAVAESLVHLLSNEHLALQLGEAARLRAIADFSWASFGRSVESILEEAARA